MAQKRNREIGNGNILFAPEVDDQQSPAAPSGTQPEDKKKSRLLSGLGRGERIAAVAICLLLVIGVFGSGLGAKIISLVESLPDITQKENQPAQNNSLLASLNPFVAEPLPTATPQLSKEYIYAGSRMLVVEDANASATPLPQYEADVLFPRPNGDGFVDADDVQQIRNFSVGVGLPYQSSEFQRADCSPRSISGDGFVDGDDVQQARRYSVGTDNLQLIGGPVSFLFKDEKQSSKSAFTYASWEQPAESAAQLLPTVLRIPSITGNTGTQMVVPVRVDASGGEAVFGFSLNYNAAKLSHPVVTIGTAGGDVITNITPTNPNANPVGFSITNFPGGTLGAGANQLLVTVRFDVAPTISAGTTDVTFDDVPGTRIARRKVVGVDPLVPLPQPVFTNGVVTIIKQIVTAYD